MVGAEHPHHVGQQLLVQAQRGRRVPALAGPDGDVAAGGQGVGVVGAEHPLLVGQQLPEQAQRGRRVTALAGPGGDVARAARTSGVVRVVAGGGL